MDATLFREDFLWFTYFGMPKSLLASNDKQRDDALTACIDRAYRDASRTMKYRLSTEKLKKAPKAERNDFADAKERFKHGEGGAGNYLADRIGILTKSPEIEFDAWHEETCGKLIEIAEEWPDGKQALFEKNGFTYGHAQKWVNMTLKNMLVMGLWDAKLSCYIGCLHIPVDSYVLAAAAIDKGKPIFEGYTAKGLGVRSTLTKWSGITDYKEYYQYQNEIRNALSEGLSPIEWESSAWIAQAKSLKN